MQNQDIKMFGTTTDSLEGFFARSYNINMTLAGMLSDAQELIAMGEIEKANQVMNSVKHYFFEYTDTRNEVVAIKLD